QPDRVDAGPLYAVQFGEDANTQLHWLEEHHGIALREEVVRALSIGATPHPYRRIKQEGPLKRLALRDWRFYFSLDGRTVTVQRVRTGYRPRHLNDPHAT